MMMFQSHIRYGDLRDPSVPSGTQVITCVNKNLKPSNTFISLPEYNQSASCFSTSEFTASEIREPVYISSGDLNSNNCTYSTGCLVPNNGQEIPITKPKLGTYVIEGTIGKGMFSSVKLARHTITGLNVAVKITDKSRLSEESLGKIHRESDVLKDLHHENIVKIYQVMETERLLCVVMEYIPNGEVFDYIATHGRFPESDARQKFRDVVCAVNYAHSRGVVHRDLKAENLLFDCDMNIKLVDFSFGTRLNKPNELLTTWCGSPPYAAPEIFLGEPYIGTKADIWSLGVVLYVLVCGALPFDAQLLPQLKNQVLSANFRVPYWLSTTCENLIRIMLTKESYKRPTTTQILEHEWFTSAPHKSTINKLPESNFPLSQNHTTDANESLCNSSSLLCNKNNGNNNTSVNGCGQFQQYPKSCFRHVTLKFPTTNLSAEMKMGEFNELIILIMESYGMMREQIIESLKRCAYDHLTATYLLLGEKIRLYQKNLLTQNNATSNPDLQSIAQIQHWIKSANEMDLDYRNPNNMLSNEQTDKNHLTSTETTIISWTNTVATATTTIATNHDLLSVSLSTSKHTFVDNMYTLQSNPTHISPTTSSNKNNTIDFSDPHQFHSYSTISSDLITPSDTANNNGNLEDEQQDIMPRLNNHFVNAIDKPRSSDQLQIGIQHNSVISSTSDRMPATCRTLKRRKYGVHAAPACLDQLTQAMLVDPDSQVMQLGEAVNDYSMDLDQR